MQFHLVSRPAGDPPPPEDDRGVGPSWGHLPLDERRTLVEYLRSETTTPDRCWFCVWEGSGGLDDRGCAARVRLPARDYFLYSGAVSAALARLDRFDQSPNLWWPEDRSWIVATEVDYAWTYVGGTSHLMDRLLADDRLEVLPATLSQKPFYDSDLLNAALDGS